MSTFVNGLAFLYIINIGLPLKTNRISVLTSETTCIMDIDFNGNRQRSTNNSDTNKDQTNKERFNTVATEDRLKVQSSLPIRQEEEIDSKRETLTIQQLCQNKQNARNKTNLQELQIDQLLNILKKDYLFHETNINVLRDHEINKFSKVYGITDAHSILSYNDLKIWLENNNGIIYIWS
ncbi:unnamed protein product [Rhizophagus irregularis]|uniref:Uncharacterized protein n=1 Tax=Rhizophagus irregularis TaxID=588596 RepID=A0A2N1NKE1_9GLOM|nr:hypothetical protein RhiirC2_774898 [Rhizophagus irregularis]CAB5300568.1 unnamed protein product [Rhizophagus irregularis]